MLDSTLDGGLRSGELVLLGGNEGSGKTTLALQMVRNAARVGRQALVFSFEHDAQTLIQRLISLEAATAAVDAGQHPAAAADVLIALEEGAREYAAGELVDVLPL